MLIRRVARPMLATTFIARGVDSLRSPKTAADAARPTLEGLSNLPDPVSTYVPSDADTVAKATAAVQIGAGLLLATGKLPRFASAALAVSVVPGSLGAHAFWNESDPERKGAERKAFLADISLIGGLIIAAVDTEGKPSLGWRGRRAARKLSEAVSGALPSGSDSALIDQELVDRIGDGLHQGAERGREFAQVARERGAEWADIARDRAPEIAELARERSAHFIDVARDRGPELADAVQRRGTHFAEVARDHAPELATAARDRTVELAERAQDRGSDLADITRKEVKRARKEAKRARREIEKRVG